MKRFKKVSFFVITILLAAASCFGIASASGSAPQASSVQFASAEAQSAPSLAAKNNGNVKGAEPPIAQKDVTVLLPDTRFAQFEFNKNTTSGYVVVTITQLDSRLNYKKFYQYLSLKTQSGTALTLGDGASGTYQYIPYSSSALLTFSLGAESIYITVSAELDNLPKPILHDPTLATALLLSANLESYRAVSRNAEWGDINLNIQNVIQNDALLNKAAAGFVGFNIQNSYHMKLLLSRKQGDKVEPLYFFGTEKLKFKATLPDYNKKYTYVLVEDLSAQGALVTKLAVEEENGFASVNFSVGQNGDFSIIVCAERVILPWWGIVLVVLGGLILLGVGIFIACLPRIKKWKKQKATPQGTPFDAQDTKNNPRTNEAVPTPASAEQGAEHCAQNAKPAIPQSTAQPSAVPIDGGAQNSKPTAPKKDKQPATAVDPVQSAKNRASHVIKKEYPQTKKRKKK